MATAMQAPTSNVTKLPNGNGTVKKPLLDPKLVGEVLEKMRDVQTESDRWELAEELAVLIPKGTFGFSDIIDKATQAGVVGNLSVNTLRLYRDTANRWPSDKRVPNVSFSAHREAMALPNIDQAVRMLNDLVKSQGASKVTVASVRKAVAIKNGKQPTAKQAAGSTSTPHVDALKDLDTNNGAGLIAAIDSNTPTDKLDRLHASVTKVLAHIEKLRAKQARAKAAAPKAKPAPASKPQVGEAKKVAGDVRGL